MTVQQKPPKDAPPKSFRLPLLFWWFVFLGLLIWNIISFWPTFESIVDLPYSAFLGQVRTNNVSEVLIRGDEIDGSFVKPIAWPADHPTGGAGAAPTAAASQPTPVSDAPTYSKFITTLPEAVGDPNLLPLLEQHAVTITAQTPSTPWLLTFIIDTLPFLLLLGFFIWTGRQAMQSQASLFSSFGRSRAATQLNQEHPDVTFEDVAGADEAKRDLQEVVDFLRHPEKYHNLGARIPRGVLLVGPPGTGKTLLARAVAGEAGVPFFHLSASEFVEMFVGVGASRVRDLFSQAKTAAPAIVFIDELDAVGRRRGAGLGAVNDEREQTLNQLLVEMDGFDEHHEVILLAATNRPDVLDPALLRPGRFDRQVVVSLPDQKGRAGILKIHTRQLRLAPTVDLATLARATIGMSGADLANLCNEAALIAARGSHRQIERADFSEALDKIMLGEARPAAVEKDPSVVNGRPVVLT